MMRGNTISPAVSSEAERIELRSDEVQEILSRPPHRLVLYGITIICTVLFLLLGGSFFFRYPDVIQGGVVITTENPPVWLMANASGKIKELLVHDKQLVHQGDVLAVIENPASTADMLMLRQLLAQTVISDSNFRFPPGLLRTCFELGAAQPAFTFFSNALTAYNNFISLNLIEQEKRIVQNQLNNRQFYKVNLQQQFVVKQRELDVVKRDYERQQQLFEKKVISSYELEVAEQKCLSKELELQQLKTSLSLENVESSQLHGNLRKMSITYLQEKNSLFNVLNAACSELHGAIENWEQSYLLQATQQGKVSFNNIWSKNQHVSVGDKVFALVSEQRGAITTRMQLPAEGSGKVKVGQLVNIKLMGYPFMEFGVLQGRVCKLSLMPDNGYYTAEISLKGGMKTSTGKCLTLTAELSGMAEVITENKSLIERIYAPVLYALKNHFQ